MRSLIPIMYCLFILLVLFSFMKTEKIGALKISCPTGDDEGSFGDKHEGEATHHGQLKSAQ